MITLCSKARRTAILLLAVAPAAGFLANQARAATWSGTTSGLWSDATNWGGTGLVAGDILNFTGASNTSTNNDVSAFNNYNGITFAATADPFTLSGLDITLNGNITDSGTSAHLISLNVGLLANTTVSVVTGGQLTINGNVSGGFDLTKNGAGTLVFGGTLSYTGNTLYDGGTVKFNTTNTIGNLTLGAATNSANVTALDLSLASLTTSNLVIRGNSTSTNTITLGATRTLTANGNVSIGNPFNTSGGNNTKTLLTVTGGNFVAGTANGIFAVGTNANGNSGNVTVTADLSAVGNVTLNYTGGTIAIAAGNGTGANAPFGSLLLGGTNTLTATNLAVGLNTGGGNASLGTLLLGTTNILNVDNVTVGAGKAAGGTTGQIKFNTGLVNPTVKLRGSDGTSAVGNFTISNGVLYTQSSGTAQVGIVDFTGGAVDALITNLTVAVGKGGTNTAAANGTLTFDSGNITATNAVVSIRSTSTQSANTTGIINVNGTGNLTLGALKLADTSVGGSTGTTSGTLNINGGLVTMNGNITGGGGIATVNLNGGTLNMQGNSLVGSTVNLNASAGALQSVGTINGTGGLTKVGTGTLTVSGANNWTGITVIKNGTIALTSATANNVANSTKLLIGDALGNTTALDVTGLNSGAGLTVASGQTVAGFGSIIGNILFGNGSILAPGNSAGILSDTGNASLGSGSSMNFDLDTPNVAGGTGGNDLFAVSGSLTIDQNVTLNVTPGINFAAGTYHLVSFASSIDNSGGFNGWSATGINPAFTYSFALTVNSLDLVVTNAPEPASLAVLTFGTAGLLLRRRRK